MHTSHNQNNKKETSASKIIPFQRTRRITGYLVGDADRWVNAKKAELHDRIKHSNGE